MTTAVIVSVLSLLPLCSSFQNDDWPPLAYLKSDYKAVRVVAHILIREAEITGRIVGYENWRIKAELIESFKGPFHKGDIIEYVHGAEAGFKKEISPDRR